MNDCKYSIQNKNPDVVCNFNASFFFNTGKIQTILFCEVLCVTAYGFILSEEVIHVLNFNLSRGTPDFNYVFMLNVLPNAIQKKEKSNPSQECNKKEKSRVAQRLFCSPVYDL